MIVVVVVVIEEAMAIKFAKVEVSSEALEVGTPSQMSCKFRKKPKETITKIIWSLEPEGQVKTNVFDTSQGSLESPVATVEQVESKYNKVVKMILQDSSFQQVKVCCLVESSVATSWDVQEHTSEACSDVAVVSQPAQVLPPQPPSKVTRSFGLPVPCYGYLLLEAAQGRADMRTDMPGATLRGQLDEKLIADIGQHTAANNRVTTELSVVDLLNVVGLHSYKVDAVNGMIWTLSRKRTDCPQ